jgi:hypothetical protein
MDWGLGLAAVLWDQFSAVDSLFSNKNNIAALQRYCLGVFRGSGFLFGL